MVQPTSNGALNSTEDRMSSGPSYFWAGVCLLVAVFGWWQASAGAVGRSPELGATRLYAAQTRPELPRPTKRILKPIEDIREGDRVVARDPETGEVSAKPVEAVFRRVSDHLRILEIRSESTNETQRIETTNEHPFWVTGKGFVNADDLNAGDRLEDSDGGFAIVNDTIQIPHPEGVPVYNFKVADWHTYHVRAHGARGPPLFVHNADCLPGIGFVSSDDLVRAVGTGTSAVSETVDVFYHATTRTNMRDLARSGIDLDSSSRFNDFGPGFYTTRDLNQARRWANERNEPGVVLEYLVPRQAINGLTRRDLGNSVTPEWRNIVWQGRNSILESSPLEYDLVEGPFLTNTGKMTPNHTSSFKAQGRGDQQAWLTPDALRVLQQIGFRER